MAGITSWRCRLSKRWSGQSRKLRTSIWLAFTAITKAPHNHGEAFAFYKALADELQNDPDDDELAPIAAKSLTASRCIYAKAFATPNSS
jgi:hypothetical protein